MRGKIGKIGIGKDGFVRQKGANSIAMSGLIRRKALVSAGRAIFILFGINGLRREPSHLVGPNQSLTACMQEGSSGQGIRRGK